MALDFGSTGQRESAMHVCHLDQIVKLMLHTARSELIISTWTKGFRLTTDWTVMFCDSNATGLVV